MVAVLEQKPTRPILRYHGGKWKLADWILSYFPPHKVYTEVFGGGGSVLIRKARSKVEIYNDLNSEVVNLFRVLRDPKLNAELERQISLTPFAREEFEAAYTATDDSLEMARRLVLRSHFGFNSAAFEKTGFRVKTTQSNKQPPKCWATLPKHLQAYLARLQGVTIEHRPAVEVIRQHDSIETLHYVDPPYVHSTRTDTRYAFDMTDDEHRELAAVLRSVQGMVILSGYPSELYDVEMYSDWHRLTRIAQVDGDRKATEVLWINDAAWERGRRQSGLFG